MQLHPLTFEYVKPSDFQVRQMAGVRNAFKTLAEILDTTLPDGPDKTYVLRHLRETAMWANIALTRHADGLPISDVIPDTCPAG